MSVTSKKFSTVDKHLEKRKKWAARGGLSKDRSSTGWRILSVFKTTFRLDLDALTNILELGNQQGVRSCENDRAGKIIHFVLCHVCTGLYTMYSATSHPQSKEAVIILAKSQINHILRFVSYIQSILNLFSFSLFTVQKGGAN